jgi:ATP-dependent DNA helicase RecG
MKLQELLVQISEGTLNEGSDVEFKSANGGFPRNIWETYSAMANSEGGIILLGIIQNGEEFTVPGLPIEIVNRYKKELWDNLHNTSKVNINLLNSSDIQVLPVDRDKMVLIIKVPRASRRQRPVYIGPNPLQGTFRRRHEGDYLCTPEEVRSMFVDAGNVPADQRILKGFSIQDLDIDTIKQYRQRFSVAKPNHAWLDLDTKDLLIKLNGWRLDRQSGEEGLTVAGLLMFGRFESITDAEAIPGYFVDYREYLTPSERWSDRLYPDGTWEANLFQFYARIWPKIAAGLPTPFILKGAQRTEDTLTHKGLREALVNALVHADYQEKGGIVIERYADRISLENPGLLLVSLEQLKHGGVSEPRNTAIQKMFLMMGGGERAGSGYNVIQSGWKSQHWRTPSVSEKHQPNRFRLVLPLISLIPDGVIEELESRFGGKIKGLNEIEVQALVTASIEEGVSNSRLQELVEAHPADITKSLSRLCDHGMLISSNQRRWSRYHLASKKILDVNLSEINKVPSNSIHMKEDSSHKKADSSHIGADSSHLEEDSSRIERPLFLVDQQIWEDLVKEVASKKKISQTKMREAILSLCQNDFLTAAQMAHVLHRDPINLRNRYLSPMVKKGLLRHKFPDAKSLNRPDQAYKANPRALAD